MSFKSAPSLSFTWPPAGSFTLHGAFSRGFLELWLWVYSFATTKKRGLGISFSHFVFHLFCYLLQAKRGGALKKALNLQQVAIAHVARPFFCGNPANELHLIVNLCVCFRPPTPSPSPFPSRTFYNFLLLCTCVVWMPRDLHLCVNVSAAGGCVRIDKIIMSRQCWECTHRKKISWNIYILK